MFKNLRTQKILWSVTAGFTLLAALAGVFFPGIYAEVFAQEFLPGAWAQDLLTALLALFVLVMVARMKAGSVRMAVFMMGVLGSWFYLYGIFAIERVYNALYILYLAIFALSFWSLLSGLMNIEEQVLEEVRPSKSMVRIAAFSGITIAVLFSLLWISALIPLMREHRRIEYLYSIYLLDLCFVMPAFLITSISALRGRKLGAVMMPAVFILGFFVIFPLGLNEVSKPFYGQNMDIGPMAMSFAFASFMLAVGLLHLKKSR